MFFNGIFNGNVFTIHFKLLKIINMFYFKKQLDKNNSRDRDLCQRKTK